MLGVGIRSKTNPLVRASDPIFVCKPRNWGQIHRSGDQLPGFFVWFSLNRRRAGLRLSLLRTFRSVRREAGGWKMDGPAPGFAEIVVVRHGETSWNASKIIQGHLDSELNEMGRQQAILVAGRLSKEPKCAAIYSSDLKRAAETAQIIANSCDLPEVILDPTLRERHLGDLQGLTLRDAAKIKPQAYKIFLSTKTDQEIPGGGESCDQFFDRCISSLERIAGKHRGERVIVVSHGGFLRQLYERASPEGSLDGKIQNTSVNVFHISETGDDWIIKTWGDIGHLQEIGALNGAFGGDKTSG